MNVINKRPLALAEVKDILKEADNKEMDDYLKKFLKLTGEKAKKMTGEIRELGNPKIKEEDIIKIADFMPEDAEDLNKIFTEVSLSEDETKIILEIVKKY